MGRRRKRRKKRWSRDGRSETSRLAINYSNQDCGTADKWLELESTISSEVSQGSQRPHVLFSMWNMSPVQIQAVLYTHTSTYRARIQEWGW
jgi:hypothetical protein